MPKVKKSAKTNNRDD